MRARWPRTWWRSPFLAIHGPPGAVGDACRSAVRGSSPMRTRCPGGAGVRAHDDRQRVRHGIEAGLRRVREVGESEDGAALGECGPRRSAVRGRGELGRKQHGEHPTLAGQLAPALQERDGEVRLVPVARPGAGAPPTESLAQLLANRDRRATRRAPTAGCPPRGRSHPARARPRNGCRSRRRGKHSSSRKRRRALRRRVKFPPDRSQRRARPADPGRGDRRTGSGRAPRARMARARRPRSSMAASSRSPAVSSSSRRRRRSASRLASPLAAAAARRAAASAVACRGARTGWRSMSRSGSARLSPCRTKASRLGSGATRSGEPSGSPAITASQSRSSAMRTADGFRSTP